MTDTARVAGLTPSQTVGPFFLDALLRADARRTALANAATPGEHIRVVGHVLDGDGLPVPDAIIEIWQADSVGHYHQGAHSVAYAPAGADFVGFGRCGTDEDGAFQFETVKPGAVPFSAGRMQAPHICVAAFARGLLNHLMTRLYFADEASANAADPVLARVPHERRATLLASRETDASTDSVVYRFDVRLQGDGETVFFNL